MPSTKALTWSLLGAAAAVFSAASSATPGAAPKADFVVPIDEINFNRDIRPILSDHCWPCHGPDKDAVAKTGGYRLDIEEEAKKDLGGYFGIKSGSIEDSMMVSRIDPEIPELSMPPPDSNIKQLDKEQVAMLKAWISQGAKYEKHWAFVPPSTPDLPQVSDRLWVHNQIDRFVLAGLDANQLTPEPEADKTTLIRRATLALTGLPPTPSEIEDFLADKTPRAYSSLIDRLLDSPRYGENQARYWLDAVRYGDTHGYHLDNERTIFPYRDWVVRAFNDDLPFDDFTRWQMAGDMLEDPTTDQLIATGFVRMNPTTNEGGSILEEVDARNIFDRVETTSTIYLGLTMTCTRCHDHKYDPLTQEDYFSMYAFFNSTTDNPMDGNIQLPGPVIKAPTPAQEKTLKAHEARQEEIESTVGFSQVQAWIDSEPTSQVTYGTWEKSGVYTAASFTAAHNTVFSAEPGGDGKDVVWKAEKIELGKGKAAVVGKDNASVYIRTTITVDKDQELEMRLGSDDAIKAWVNGSLIHNNEVARGLTADADKVVVKLTSGSNKIVFKVTNGGGQDGFYAAFGDKRGESISNAATLLKNVNRTPEQDLALRRIYLMNGPGTKANTEWREVNKNRLDLLATIPSTLIAKEKPEPKPAFVLHRGEYDHPRHEVKREIPVVLGTMPEDLRRDRMGLADWLLDPQNPLTARVYVNRVWQQHFGVGLVKTSENFGAQGEWPSHPELLDWLARDFVDNGWSVKRLHKQIMTSAAYMQTSSAPSEKVMADPENRMISRGPRFRLSGEVIRDQALYVSGLLIEDGGGKGDKPYQPLGLWKAVGYTSSNTANYVQDKGQALYRRSLYMFWKRTSPPATLAIFDAPTREACTVRRSTTNTPLQALATMNDPQFFEASRAFAERIIGTTDSDEERLALAFSLCTGRTPLSSELQILQRILNQERAEYLAKPENALKLLTVGESKRNEALDASEHAAWTVLCSLILNLDETLTTH